jgi:hypothetical protein
MVRFLFLCEHFSKCAFIGILDKISFVENESGTALTVLAAYHTTGSLLMR